MTASRRERKISELRDQIKLRKLIIDEKKEDHSEAFNLARKLSIEYVDVDPLIHFFTCSMHQLKREITEEQGKLTVLNYKMGKLVAKEEKLKRLEN